MLIEVVLALFDPVRELPEVLVSQRDSLRRHAESLPPAGLFFTDLEGYFDVLDLPDQATDLVKLRLGPHLSFQAEVSHNLLDLRQIVLAVKVLLDLVSEVYTHQGGVIGRDRGHQRHPRVRLHDLGQ